MPVVWSGNRYDVYIITCDQFTKVAICCTVIIPVPFIDNFLCSLKMMCVYIADRNNTSILFKQK